MDDTDETLRGPERIDPHILGQRPSNVTREKRLEDCLKLLLDGFTAEEIDDTIPWLIEPHPTTGSFARLSPFIDQAMKEGPPEEARHEGQQG